ncbi:twin-arginine translocation signal domain-containing protein [Natrinema altunense]|uniref:Twin-arginine translocation signal domain-containing protein n=1 Tax=Natrinema altunense TaxID=222984 RepID=A0A482Y8U3_9EURY|nr:twin-arginine translocation signal domain-containing protein [Natrinema altunense]RZH69207.1 twin-arginine translocation signal domain-containing protein [Natrinema altunense]
MNRRDFLVGAGALSAVLGAGCQSLRDDPDPGFEIRTVRTYQPDADTVLVVTTVEKRTGVAGHVTLRAELRVDGDYDHAFVQEYVVPQDVAERTLAVPFEYDDAVFENATYDARVKILREGDADSQWVTENRTATETR